MKKETHPEYYKDAKVTCACGNKMTIGSTQEKIEVEICSNCHPFYTGEDQLLDTAGRAEKFEKRRKTAQAKGKGNKKEESKKEDEKEDKKEESESETSELIQKANEKLNN